MESDADQVHTDARTLHGLVAYFLRLGAYGFGGPIALVGYMHRDLVEQRGWFNDDEYRQGLALAQTMPGPLAAQLAMWLGFLTRGIVGSAAVAVAFVAPPFLLVTAVAVIYVEHQGSSVVHALFRGVGPARDLERSACSSSRLGCLRSDRGSPWCPSCTKASSAITTGSPSNSSWIASLSGSSRPARL